MNQRKTDFLNYLKTFKRNCSCTSTEFYQQMV